jgi:anti-sigma factor RsiW
MTCREFEEWILESLDAPLAFAHAKTLAEHLSACPSCAAFQKIQQTLDRALVEHCVAPEPRAELALALRRRVQAEKQSALWDLTPDLLHLGGGFAATLATAALFPASPATVIAAGTVLTLLTYFPQVLLRGLIELPEEN